MGAIRAKAKAESKAGEIMAGLGANARAEAGKKPKAGAEAPKMIDLDMPRGRGSKARPIPGIERTPGVCGGNPCIRQTRIPVWSLEQARRLGMTEGEILEDHPTLRAEDLVHAWAYVAAHRDEIDRQIRENEDA